MDTSESDNTVYILDSYGLIYRAYYALFNHPLTNKKGDNISAVVIFFRNLKALLTKYKPAYLAAAFDSRTKTFRHQLYSEYKATRNKTPEDLLAQVPWIEEILTALGVPVLRCDGFEADDVIATVAKKCAQKKMDCRILSGDKDLLQLVTETCKEMQPDKTSGGWETTGTDEVIAKWGIPPGKILDYLSLVGDASDNVPGVKGVGDKTALKLLSDYGDLDGIYAHADEIKGALGNKIRADKESAYFSKKLITLRDDVPLDIDFDDFKTDGLDFSAAAKKLSGYGAYQAAKSFDPAADGTDGARSTSKKTVAAAEKSTASHKDSPDAGEGTAEQDDNARPLTQNKGNYSPCTKLSELTALVDAVLSGQEKSVALDTETDSLCTHEARLVGFSLCREKGTAVYVPVILPGSGEMFAPETIPLKDCVAQLERLLLNPEVTLVMHNGKFDLEVLYTNGATNIPRCRIADTMIAAWLLNPDNDGKSPYSLETLAEKELCLAGIEFSDIVEKGKTFADVPLEKAFPYGAEDADFTWQLWQIFREQIERNGLGELFYGMEMKVLPVLARMEEEGIHLDKKTLSDYSIELAEEIRAKEKEIYAEVGHEFNIASTKQLQKVLFEERGLVPIKKTKTGYSTDNAVLEELAERTTDPVPRAILDHRSFTKLQSTYVETLPTLADKNSRVHTTFIQTGTATGRLSSRDPNLQNIPVRMEAGRRIRSAFTAPEGMVLISADYAQIELVVLAHLSGDKNLCAAFNQGIDVHKSTAALIYGIPPEQVTPEQRRFAKTVNFGVMYGMSPFRLSRELGIRRAEADEFIDQYFATYADVRRFIDETISAAKANGFTETMMHRRRYIPDINSRNKLEANSAERIAINTPIQGSAADIVKKAMCDVQAALDKSSSPARMLLQVHDELIFQCPQDEAVLKDSISLIKEKMESAVKLNVPLKVSLEYGANWGQFH